MTHSPTSCRMSNKIGVFRSRSLGYDSSMVSIVRRSWVSEYFRSTHWRANDELCFLLQPYCVLIELSALLPPQLGEDSVADSLALSGDSPTFPIHCRTVVSIVVSSHSLVLRLSMPREVDSFARR